MSDSARISRISWIDTARGLGLLAVFVGHLNVPMASAWVYTFHMPLFFLLSGLLYPGCEKYTFTQFAWKRFKGIIIPYFTLGSVIALFYCCLYAYYHEPVSTYLEMAKAFLIQEHYWTVWFLTALYFSQILYYCLDKWFHRWDYAVTIVSLVVCVFGLMRYRLGWGALPWNLDIALIAQFFFHLGYRFMHNDRIREFFISPGGNLKRLGIVIACLTINLIAAKACIITSGQSLDMSIGMYGNEVFTFIAAMAGILMVFTVAPVVHSRFISYLGQNTMILFSWHSRIVIVFCGLVYAHFNMFQSHDVETELLRATLTLLVILVALIPVNECVKRLPCHKAFGV